MASDGARATTFRNAKEGVENDGGRFYGIHWATDTRQKVRDRYLLVRVVCEGVRLGKKSHLVVAVRNLCKAFIQEVACHD